MPDLRESAPHRTVPRRIVPRRTAVAIATMTLLIALIACAPHRAPASTTDAQIANAFTAHDDMDALLVSAQNVVGGTWRSTDGGAEFCTTASGKQGAVWPFGRLGPGVPAAAQETALNGVAHTWKAAGFPATRSGLGSEGGSAVTQLRYPAAGYGTDGVYLIFTINENGSSFDAQSRCVAANADKVNDSRIARG